MTTPPLSANLGFLWPELELLDAIRAAHRAGFDAVELHWPYITHAVEVALLLEELGLPLISLNTVGGDLSKGEFGLAALPGRQGEARAAIDKALAYASDVSSRWVHVLAGKTAHRRAADTLVENLRYAAERGRAYGVGILIEAISPQSIEGYYLDQVDLAVDIVERVSEPNVRLLFDCYHAQLIHGRVLGLIRDHLEVIGHIQIAAVPGRAEPDHGVIDYPKLLGQLLELGYDGYVGAEYQPAGSTDDGLTWLGSLNR